MQCQVKSMLQEQFPSPPQPTLSEPAQGPAASVPRGPSPTVEDDTDADMDEMYAVPTAAGSTVRGGELRSIADTISHAREADIDALDLDLSRRYSDANANSDSRPFKKKISQLFDFGNPAWIKRIEGFASLGLDQELELYELLDFDGAGEHIPLGDMASALAGIGSEGVQGEGDGEIELDEVTSDVLYS